MYERLSQRSFELTQLEMLADATQQLYLGLPSLHEWLHTEWEKRRQKRAHRKGRGENKPVIDRDEKINREIYE